jgi:[ribosomal protein S5]-alanine N-acetyltransferase
MTGSYSIPPILRTARLMLRPICVEDASDIFAYGADPKVTRYVTWPTHRTIEDALDFVNRRLRAHEMGPVLGWGITEGEGRPVIGCIGIDAISDKHFSGEMGYVLARPFWGRGMMTEAVRTVIDAVFRFTPLNRIEANCLIANAASARVMEKSGMTFEGVGREVSYFKEAFQDLKRFAILRRDWLGARGR